MAIIKRIKVATLTCLKIGPFKVIKVATLTCLKSGHFKAS